MLIFKVRKDLARLKKTVVRIIDSIEIEDTSSPSAKPDILRQLEPILDEYAEEAKKWSPHQELHQLAYGILYNISFNLLSSGDFHVRPGKINERGPGKSLQHIAEACLDYYVIAGIYSESWKERQLARIADAIARAKQLLNLARAPARRAPFLVSQIRHES